ncbi:MAG: serine--tRNA ligase [Bacillota bacterium]
MLDLQRIRDNPEELKRMLASRSMETDEVDGLLKKDALRRRLTADSEEKKALRNQMSRQVGTAKQQGASGEAVSMIMNQMRALGSEIAAMDVDIAELDDKINAFLLSAPNYPHASVPVGKADANSEEAYRWGAPRKLRREPKPYWIIGSDLRILDFDNTAKLRGTQITVYRDLGAQLERAVINFFLDTHIGAGYREVITPYVVMSDAADEPPELPITDEAGEISRAPAAESAVTNLYRGMILDGGELPVSHCAFSAFFRSNIGGGHDTGGLFHQNQLNNVELATICRPGQSYDELTRMTEQAQKVLQLLRLPYRVMLLCTGRLAHSAAKTYGLEVWIPSYKRYVGVSGCSNCEDYRARRLNIRYRDPAGGEPQFCHTLNGSGVAIGRTVAAILENHQNEDGSVTVPEALRPYMHTDSIR